MQINVFMEKEKKRTRIKLDEHSTLKDLLKELKINSVTVIATRNDELIPDNGKLKDKDEIKIMPVVSGG